MISKTPKDLGLKIGHKFEAIETQLKTKTTSPEDVDALKQAMVTMPMKIHELSGEIYSTEVHVHILKLLLILLTPHCPRGPKVFSHSQAV